MAKTAKLPADDAATESADLMVMASVNPLAVFTDREQFSQFYTRMKAETDKHVPDLSTSAGRDAVRSLAFKVTKAKTTLDKAGLGLTEEWRQKVALVNASRKEMVDQLDALAAEVRRPLTDWEAAEKARVERCRAVITGLQDAAAVTLEDTSSTVRDRGKQVWATEIGEDFGDLAEEAKTAKATTVATLQRALERLTKEEADRAELEALRAAQAEREAREAAEREAAEQAERERLAAEAEERRRKEAEEAEAQRIRDAEERAAQAAREEADRIAREAEQQREREHEAALAEERRQREEAERINREAEERRAAEEAEAARQAAEEARRAKNRAHRAQIMGEAKISIMAAGQAGEHPVTEAAAVAIVRAIAAGSIPHVTLAF